MAEILFCSTYFLCLHIFGSCSFDNHLYAHLGCDNLSIINNDYYGNIVLQSQQDPFVACFVSIHENLLFSEVTNVLKYICRGTSLCSGDLHPDKIVGRELHLKSEKSEYYTHIHNYHNE